MDDKTIELIHGAIDGANAPGDQRELERSLEASAETRREYEQLQWLCALLDAEPDFEPPAGLRESILAQAPVSRAPVIALRPRRTWLAAAVALAASAAGIALLLGRGPELPELDSSVLAGTMSPAGPAAGMPALLLDEAVISGAINLRGGDGRHAIEIDLDAARPVVIVASAAGAPLQIVGLVPLAGAPAEVSEIGGRTRLLHDGYQRYALVLDSTEGVPESIDLSIYDGNQLVRQGRLIWQAATPAGRQ